MENEDQNDLSRIVDFLKDMKFYKIKEDKKDEFQFYGESDKSLIEDYASLTTIKALKQNPEYYLTKWNIIINNLISLEDYFFYLKKNKNFEIKEKDHIPKKRGKKNKNKKENNTPVFYNSSSEITSEDKESSSIFENNIIHHVSNNDIQRKEINEFKLKYIKTYMKISFIDKIDGPSFESYVKKTLNVMLLILKIDYYDFLHPKEAAYKKLMEITNSSTSAETKTREFEIDLLINGFYEKDLQSLLDKYPNHFFFKEQLGDLKISSKHKFNIVSEISTNLIMFAISKNEQVEKYINILKAFEKFKNENILALSEEKNKTTIDSFMIDPYNENIFIFITNCSYFLLKFAVKLATNIFDKEKQSETIITDEEIKKLIKNEITSDTIKKTPLIYNLIKNEDNLSENLFSFYKLFYKLRMNKIKHCLFYIGEESGTEYEESMMKIANIQQNVLNNEDIYIIYKVKSLIKELYKINTNFIEILQNFGGKIFQYLSNNKKEELKELCKCVKLTNLDLIRVKIYLNKKHENVSKIIKEQKYFIYDIELVNDEKMNNAMDIIEKSNYNIILFINDNDDLYFKSQKLRNEKNLGRKEVYYFDPSKNFSKLMKYIKLNLSEEFIRENIGTIPNIQKHFYDSEGILDYKKLSNKIKKELDIDIGENKMKELINITLTNEEKEKHFNDIERNIIFVGKMLGLNNIKKIIENLKKKYHERIAILEENIKTSIFCDYIYLHLIPELKYQEALKFYKT